MKFAKSFVLIFSLAVLAGCNNQSFKAEAPEDYKDNAKYGFGSLIKDKDSVLRKYFVPNESNSNQPENIGVEKDSCDKENKQWNSAVVALKDFPIAFMDKKNGVLETEKVKIHQFDNTGTCSYVVKVKLLNKNNFAVTVMSNEDSAARLRKHEDFIKAKITAEFNK